jgi:hypothetical protein
VVQGTVKKIGAKALGMSNGDIAEEVVKGTEKKKRAKGPHAAWQKSFKEIQDQLTAELYQASQHEEVKKAFAAAVTIFRYWWDHASDDEFPLVSESPYMRELVAFIQQHAPDLADVYGANIYKFLLQGIFWACRIPWPAEWGIGRRKLGPGRHLIYEGGRYDGVEAMTEEQFFEYRAYLRSQTPPKKRGPKKKVANIPPEKPCQGEWSIDPDFAMKAAAMAANGYKKREIAAQLLPDEHIRDKKSYNRVYSKISRAVERGNLMLQQKKGYGRF